MQPDAGMEDVKQTWSGPCVGGPLDGQEAVSRHPSGFLLIDRPAGKVWIYDWAGTQFMVRIADGEELIEDDKAPKNRYRAAEEFEYDVMAAPWLDGAPQDDAEVAERDFA